MSIKYEHLKISEEIPAGTFVAQIFTPLAIVKKLELNRFAGDAAFSTTNAVVMVIWDYGGTDEREIWTTKGVNAPHDLAEIITDADGTKKLAVVCDNSESSDIFMSVRLDMRVIS